MTPPAPAIDWRHVLGPVADDPVIREELPSLTRATGQRPRRAIRLSPRLTSDQLPFEVEPVAWYQGGFFLKSPSILPGHFLHYAAGDYYIQDAGSMLALALCEIQPGQSVCDTCASPGGKSTGALEQLDGTGVLVSNEVIGSRLSILNLALARGGFANHLTTSLEIERLSLHLGPSFDCVIVDAPCTGQSMVVRGKQSMAAYSTAQIDHSSARQKRILRAAAELVKPGGRLVYSTCTFSYAENEHIVQGLIDEQPQWALKRFPQLAAWESPGFEGCYRLWPHRDHCAGAFAAALVRNSTDSPKPLKEPSPKRIRHSWITLPGLPREIDWLEEMEPHDGRWMRRGQHIHRFSAGFHPNWIELAQGGLAVAEQRGERFEPLYDSAVAQRAGLIAKASVQLSDDEAMRYVAGEAIRRADLPKAWCVVCWRGRPLAWGKQAGGTLKNHYPKPLRQARHP